MNISKLRRSVLLSVLAVTAISVAACTTPTEVKPPATPVPSPAATASPAASPANSPAASPGAVSKVDALIGKWPGKEGTYLNIVKKGDKYTIEIANLDGAKTFEGTAKGDTIEFTRNGKTETIQAVSGTDTGMKGFEKATDCVVVTKGSEGYCKK
jgi:hypothetical protein